MAKLFKQLQPQLGIKVTDTTGYNPKGNGQVERMHRDLGGILRALTTECGDPFAWEDLLHRRSSRSEQQCVNPRDWPHIGSYSGGSVVPP